MFSREPRRRRAPCARHHARNRPTSAIPAGSACTRPVARRGPRSAARHARRTASAASRRSLRARGQPSSRPPASRSEPRKKREGVATVRPPRAGSARYGHARDERPKRETCVAQHQGSSIADRHQATGASRRVDATRFVGADENAHGGMDVEASADAQEEVAHRRRERVTYLAERDCGCGRRHQRSPWRGPGRRPRLAGRPRRPGRARARATPP